MRSESGDRQPERLPDDLLDSLRAVLCAEPLPSALIDRIRRDLERRGADARRSVVPLPRMPWLAAAACLMAALMLPPERPTRISPSAASLRLSRDDAAEIAAAYRVLSWDNPFDYTLESIDATLDDLQRRLEGDTGTATLPWGPQDDWDVPPATDDGAMRDSLPDARLCLTRLFSDTMDSRLERSA